MGLEYSEKKITFAKQEKKIEYTIKKKVTCTTGKKKWSKKELE